MTTVVRIRRKGGVVRVGCDVYIGRRMTMGGWDLPDTKWGNPYKVGMEGVPNAETAVLYYWQWLHQSEQATLLASVGELKGKVLGCWCKEKGHEYCHGDVLQFLADGSRLDALSEPLRMIFQVAGLMPTTTPETVPTTVADSTATLTAEMKALQLQPAPLAAPIVTTVSITTTTPADSTVKQPRVQLDRVQAALIGLALGDALGVPHEFDTQTPYTGQLEHRYVYNLGKRFGHPDRVLAVGQYSDDTEMTLALARSLIRKQDYDKVDVIRSYIRFSNSGTPMMGKTTRELFKVNPDTKKDKGGYDHYSNAFYKKYKIYNTIPFRNTSTEAEQSQSNGCLMRCFPLACLWKTEAVLEDVWASNPSRVALDAVSLQVLCLRLALMGQSAKEIWAAVVSTPTTPEVKEVMSDILNSVPRELVYRDGVKVKGWVCSALYVSMRCLAALASDTPLTYPQLLQWIIAGHPGSDTDTNACVAGALIGAIVGWEALISDATTVKNIHVLLASTREDSVTDVKREPEYRLDDYSELARQLTILSSLY